MTAEESYLEKLCPLASTSSQYNTSNEKQQAWIEHNSTTFRAAYWHLDEDSAVSLPWTADGILLQCRADVDSGTPSILLLENIPLELMAMLGVAFSIDPQCWLSYISNPTGPTAWDALFRTHSRFNVERIARKSGWAPDHATSEPGRDAQHAMPMDFTGQFGKMTAFAQPFERQQYGRYPRLEHADSGHGASMSINLTYFLLADTICIILVDACRGVYIPRTRCTEPKIPLLRIPCSEAWDGLVIPCIRAFDACDVFTTMAHFLSITANRHVLFPPAASPPCIADPIILAYHLSGSLHRSNLRLLESQIHDIAFKWLQSDDANDLERMSKVLHSLREELVLLQSQVAHVKRTIHPLVRARLSDPPPSSAAATTTMVTTPSPLTVFDETQAETASLQHFLMETFHLLTSTLSLRDMRLSIEQAARTATLTQLAAIYLPLTLVTGIFGMNVREITREAAEPHWWLALVVLGCVVLLTMIGLWARGAWKRCGAEVVEKGWEWWKESRRWVRRTWYYR